MSKKDVKKEEVAKKTASSEKGSKSAKGEKPTVYTTHNDYDPA